MQFDNNILINLLQTHITYEKALYHYINKSGCT